MSDEPIEAITKRDTHQRQKMWDSWQKVYDALHLELNDPTKDPFETQAADILAMLGAFLMSQMERAYQQDRSKFLHDHQIQEIRNAHKPGMAQISLCVMQIVGAIIGGGVGCVPSVTGAVGNAAKSYHSVSGAIQGAMVGGSQTISGLLQTERQGTIASLNAGAELTRQQHQDHNNQQQMLHRLFQTHLEQQKQKAQVKHETTRSLTQ